MGGSINQNVLKDFKITNPLNELLDFMFERQSIYLKRQNGNPFPWTQDKTLQTYKFCNIFRDQDKTTRWILDWVKPLSGKNLIANLIYARFCNNPDVMLKTGYIHNYYNDPSKFIAVIDEIGGGKTKSKVNKNPVWKDPYQIAGAFKTKLGYPTREALLASHIKLKIDEISECIEKNKDQLDLSVVLDELAKIWGYKSTMVFTQVLLDLSHLGITNKLCIYPLGDGAKPVLKIFNTQDEHELITKICEAWNTKYKDQRNLKPMDAEYGLCEWRKYLVWKNNLAKKKRVFKQ